MLWMLLSLADRELFTTNIGSDDSPIVIDQCQILLKRVCMLITACMLNRMNMVDDKGKKVKPEA